jgi:hypothetical protein
MRHRLYYLLPDVESARRTFDDLLLNRIEQRHVHFLASGPLPEDMPEANVFLRTNLICGAERGMMVGALLGLALGAIIVLNFDMVSPHTVIVAAAIIGVLFGGWAASLVAAARPNSRLENFYPEIEKGKVLMIADVPARRVEQIERVMLERHPELRFSGEEPTVPVFP